MNTSRDTQIDWIEYHLCDDCALVVEHGIDAVDLSADRERAVSDGLDAIGYPLTQLREEYGADECEACHDGALFEHMIYGLDPRFA